MALNQFQESKEGVYIYYKEETFSDHWGKMQSGMKKDMENLSVGSVHNRQKAGLILV
jgi:hypothetical protein